MAFIDYGQEERKRDSQIDDAKEAVMEIFNAEPERIFYSVQIETRLEREFFHWITGKALLELTRERALAREIRNIEPTNQVVNFYRHPKYRYPKRESTQIASLLSELYDPDFTQALGRHCEMLLDSGFARAGFIPVATETNEWQGVKWTETNHNMDRIVTKGDLAFGVEIKNTQN